MDAYQPRRFRTDKPGSDVRPPSEILAPGEPGSIPRLKAPLTVKYADWREESTPNLTILQIALGEARKLPLTVFVTMALMFVSGALIARPSSPEVAITSVWASLTVIGCLVYLWLLFSQAPTYLDAELLAALTDIWDDSGLQIPVQMQLFCERFPFDSDTGFLSVIDGSLYFSGSRTSFSFSPRAARRPGDLRTGSRSFEFYRNGLPYLVGFRSLQTDISSQALSGVLQEWGVSRPVQNPVEVLPPTRPSSEAIRKLQARSIRKLGLPLSLLPLPLGFALGCWLAPGLWEYEPWPFGLLLLVWVGVALLRCSSAIRRDTESLNRLAAEDFSQMLKQ